MALVEKLSSPSSMTKYQKMSALLVNGDQNPVKMAPRASWGCCRARGKPINAVDTKDDALMAAWAKGRLKISVRVDPRSSNHGLRIDSDMLRQMGLASNAPEKKQ